MAFESPIVVEFFEGLDLFGGKVLVIFVDPNDAFVNREVSAQATIS